MPAGTIERRELKEMLAALLAHWREIERDIKRAELIKSEVSIPAINELRYAGRQLLNGVLTYGNGRMSDAQRRTLYKRLVIAEQYLLNAEHDVIDSVLKFVGDTVVFLDDEYGISEITIIYPEYPRIRQRLSECYALVMETRQDYNKRKENYRKIKREYLEEIAGSVEQMREAEIKAKTIRRQLEAKLAAEKARADKYRLFNYIAGAASIVSLLLAVLT